MPPKKDSQCKKGRQKEVIYSILIECSEIVTDEFWKQFYKDLATGKSTKGIYISNGVIQTSNKRNGFIYTITDKAPEVIVHELHHLLTTYTNICSKRDMTKKRQILKEIEDELEEYKTSKWSSIKRKNYKNSLFIQYVLYLQRTYNLSWTATINAYKTILSAFDYKTHNSKDVNYFNGKIIDIEDIEYSNGYIINTREIIEDEVKDEYLYTEGKASLQKLFEPYISAWLKFTKE
jgi:hypothetical protein